METAASSELISKQIQRNQEVVALRIDVKLARLAEENKQLREQNMQLKDLFVEENRQLREQNQTNQNQILVQLAEIQKQLGQMKQQNQQQVL